MAIVIEQNKKRSGWFGILAALFFLTIIVGGGYYLFFAPLPAIEIVAPLPLQSAVELSQLTFDPSSVVNSREFKRLRIYASVPSTGYLGRGNPFLPL